MFNSNLGKIFNGAFLESITDFNISSQEQFNQLSCSYYWYMPDSLNGPGDFGIAIPLSTPTWCFWLAINTNGSIRTKTNINNNGWGQWNDTTSGIYNLQQRINRYLLDYQNLETLHFSASDGNLYVSVNEGTYVGQVALTRIK